MKCGDLTHDLLLDPATPAVRAHLVGCAECRGRAAERVRSDHRALAPGVDADLRRRGAHGFHPGVVLPRLGP